MKAVYCPYCGGRTKRNGRTSSGSQRWRCTACGASTTVRYDDTATRLDEFVGTAGAGSPRPWLLLIARDLMGIGLPGGDAGRRAVLQAQDGRVLGGLAHARRPSTATNNMDLAPTRMRRIRHALPEPARSYAAAASGWSPGTWRGRRTRGRGRPSWRRSRRPTWSSPTAGAGSPRPCERPGRAPGSRGAPSTPSRRSSMLDTTTRPKLQAGRELLPLIARDLMGIETLHQAELWVERYLDWCGFWADFLEDRTVVDGRRVYTHEAEAGALVAVVAGVGGDAVHLPRPRPCQGRPAAVDQQHDRGRGEQRVLLLLGLAAEGRTAQPPGADVRQAR